MKTIFQKIGMVVTMLLSFTPAYAYDFEVNGIRYDITSFTELLVTASSISDVLEGEISIPSDVAFNGKTLSVVAISDNFAKCNQKITAIRIGNGVKEIGSFAFAECSNLSSIEIPESTISIGASAFANCASLKKTKALGLETLGENSFSNCVSIEQASFPKLPHVPSSAFSGCKSLSYAELTSAITIGNSSFAGCAFSSFDVPSSVTIIGSNAFADCQNLEIFVISSNVTNIGTGLFSNCSTLREVHIGSGITTLPWIFGGCDNLEILRIEDAQTTLTFEYCGTREFTDGIEDNPINYTTEDYRPVSSMFQNLNLKEVYIGRNITTEAFCYKSVYMSGSYDGRYYYYIPNPPFSNSNISKLEIGPLVTDFKMCASKTRGYRVYVDGSWDGAFQNCTNLVDVNIQASATTIEDNAFAGCEALQEITIPNAVKSLGKGVFQNCIALSSIDLGCYLISIGSDAFTGDTSLSSINLRSSNPPTYTTGFSSSEYINTAVNIPFGSIDNYKNSEPWKNFWNLKERKDLISLFDVDGLQYLVSANNDVQIIGESLSSSLNLYISPSVTYSDTEYNVTSIANNAFKNCLMIEALEIGEGIVYVGSNAFEGCENLKEVSLPESLNVIGDGAFKNCSKLQTLNTTKPIENIPQECFYGCSSLTNFSFEGVRSIGNYSFCYCDGLSKVVIAPSVEKFGLEAFQPCSNLREFVIEDSNSPIAFPYGAYDGVTDDLKKEVNGKTIQFKIQYYNGYFSGLPIEKLYIGRNLSDKSRYTICGYGDVDCYLITSYDAPFGNLTKLNEITIGENVSVLGPQDEFISEVELYSTSGSFKDCANVERVTVKNTLPPSGAEFSKSTYANASLVVPDNTVSLYQAADGWKEFVSILDETSASIEDINVNDISSNMLITPDGITYVGDLVERVDIYGIEGNIYYSANMKPQQSVALSRGIYVVKIKNKVIKVRI